MHRLLERQLRRHFGSLEAVPESLRPLIEAVDASYVAADEDRRLVERSLDLASQELVQSNTELRAKQQEQRAIFDSVPAMIIYKDTENRILRLNEVAAKVMGGTAASLEGKQASDLMPQAIADALHRDDLEVIRTGQPKLGVIESHPDGAGQMRWVRTDKVPYRDDSGSVIGVVVMAVDITERKAAEDALRTSEERLKAAYEQLKQVDRERTQFINNAAHELGTPLTPIKLQIHAVKNRLERVHDTEQVRAVQVLERNFERLSELVKDLLDSARLQADNLRLLPQPLDLRDVVRQSMEGYREAVKAHSLALHFQDGPPMPVVADPVRLGQVFDNLLSNAVKFTPPGGRIMVSCGVEGGQATVCVQDTGMGIRPEDLQRLFKPFSQVHDFMQHAAGGTGLGLYISKGIAQAHGGTLGCESGGPGQGAAFWLRLPLAKAGAPAAGLAHGMARAGDAAPPDAAGQPA